MFVVPLGTTGKSEIDVYVTLLKIGPSTAGFISEKTKLNRSHIYDIFTKLINRGFVSFFEKNKTKYFNASPPEGILDYIKEIEKEADSSIAELKQLKEISGRASKVQLFEGESGVKSVLRDIVREKKDYFVLGEEGLFQEKLPVYIYQFIRDVEYNKIKEKIISKKSMKGKIIAGKTSEIKYLDDDFFSPINTVIYGNKVAIFVWSETYNVMLIENKEIANSYMSYFKQLWQKAK
ncbi:hypothetical protein J4474_00590 [Candidatus Pacearchaeota archaeon]|nr:hypothetical protein [Candidatus Pacearchaeota archaeon]